MSIAGMDGRVTERRYSPMKRTRFLYVFIFVLIVATVALTEVAHATIRQVTDNDYDGGGPRINNQEQVVWSGDAGHDWEIFLNQSGDEVIIDFGATNGILVRYGDGSWEQLHSLSPEIMVVGDIDGNGLDDLVVDFGAAYGIWVRYDDGSWIQLHGLSPEIMVVGDIDGNGLDDLIIDFGCASGIWIRYDDGSWIQLHGLSPEIMVVGDIDGNGLDDLVVDFGAAYGIWVRYDDGSWIQLHGLSPEIMVVGDIDGNGLDDLVVDFGAAYGIWVRYDDGSWIQLHGLSPEIMVVGDIDGNGLDDLVVDFGAAYGIWVRYDDGSWEQLHSLSPEIMVVGDIDGSGLDDLIVDFGANYGIWVYYNNSTWTKIHNYSSEIMCTNICGSDDSGTHIFNLPQTGQTTCYNASGSVIECPNTGQDGDILAGVSWPTPRFTDNCDGTVTDGLTGLMWLKDGNCFGSQPWANALTTVGHFNVNPGAYGCQDYTANYNDWRLPNINELESLVNAEEASQAIWLVGQGFTNVQSSNYWSSTTYVPDTDAGWRVNMEDGRAAAGYKTCSLCSGWPVRATTSPPAQLWKTGQTTSYAAGDDGDLQRGITWPSPRFTNNGDGTVTDNLTLLIWTGDANAPGPTGCTTGMTMRWQDALDYVACINTSNYLGYNDWRLPNRKELHSLTDFSQSIPALPADYLTYFTNVQSDYYWSSTTYALDTDSGWRVDMWDGYVRGDLKTSTYYVWPVRGGQ